MTFEEHLEATKDENGIMHLDEAERARADELSKRPDRAMAEKAAHAERMAWEKRHGQIYRKQIEQPALSPEFDRELKVKVGGNDVALYGEMNLERIRSRMDSRTAVHVREIRAFEKEWEHWNQWTQVLRPDQSIDDVYAEMGT